MNKGYCKGCGRPIVWIKTAGGRSMPCDAKPLVYWARYKAPGKVVTSNGAVISCDFKGEPSKASGIGYISHFASCPAARKFRRK